MNDEYTEEISKLEQREKKLLEEKLKMKENLIQDFSNKKEYHINQLNLLREQCKSYEQ